MKDSQDFQSYTRELKEKIREWGGDRVGIASVEPLKALPVDPLDLLEPFTTAVSIAIRLPWATFGDIKDRPTLIYDEVYQTANSLLNKLAFKTACYLEDDGYYSIPIPASQMTDEKNWYGAISHKAVARMAGLGWQGKNLLLVTPEYGSSVRLITILTSAPLTVDTPVENRCGKCTRCQEACPAGAIKGVNTKSNYRNRNEALFLDKCVAQLKKHSQMLEAYPLTDKTKVGEPTYHKLICGLCIKACPFGKKPKTALTRN
ncbi:MAG: 4Fe-4S dicluster domain-containing protein [Desulfobacterales bacterium]|nr:4Fe-4S dicluster domain-containing protein [Desulfobacterales bacterium]